MSILPAVVNRLVVTKGHLESCPLRRRVNARFVQTGLLLVALASAICACHTAAIAQDSTGSPPDVNQANDAVDASAEYNKELEEAMADPEFAKGRAESQAEFSAAKTRLASVMYELRSIQLRYRNLEKRGPETRSEFIKQRRMAQLAMNETFDAAMNFFSFGGSAEAIQFILTMVENRHTNDIYDAKTMEAATRLIDGGQRGIFLFEAAARSAVVTGNFDLATRLYDAVRMDELSKVDRQFQDHMDELKEDFKIEMEQRKLDEDSQLPQVEFETTQGNFTIELFMRNSPSTVSHFVRLVETGFYDGLDFGQVIKALLALTGDPASNGSGNSGQFLIDESQGDAAPRRALRGSVLMAKLPKKDGLLVPHSASSQIAILLLPMSYVHLQQTIVGRVTDGMDVVSRLRRIDPSKEKKKGAIETPPDRVIHARVLSRPDELPDSDYVQLGRPTG